jgi:hypothetical protein
LEMLVFTAFCAIKSNNFINDCRLNIRLQFLDDHLSIIACRIKTCPNKFSAETEFHKNRFLLDVGFRRLGPLLRGHRRQLVSRARVA